MINDTDKKDEKNIKRREKLLSKFQERFQPKGFSEKTIEKHFKEIPDGLVESYLESMNYTLEDYLNDIDMDILMEIVKRHKEFNSFDALHGAACGFAALPLFQNSDSNRDLFIGFMMKEEMCSLEERDKFKEALLTFYDRTEDFMFAENFVPYCGSWEFKDFETNNPKDWCFWFMSAFMLIKEAFCITEEEFLKAFHLELVPVLALGLDENDPQIVSLKKGIAEKGESWEKVREEMFKSLPDVPLYLSEKAEEYVDELERELELSRLKPVKSEKVGRNDPCPCGSGKKYKKCCGK